MATYRQGMTDPYVGTIQKSLLDAGYDVGPMDNIYGPKTASAVKQFQTDRGITADSIWGPQTQGAYDSWSKLPTSTTGTTTATRNPAAVGHGGNLTPTGVLTPGTTGGVTGGTVLPDSTYTEGGIKYDRINGQLYKNGVLVPEENWKYLPSAIGGTRGVVLPEEVIDDEIIDDEVIDDKGGGGLTSGFSDALIKLLEDYTKKITTPFDDDPTKSPLYGPMKEQYTKAGRAAFENTIGRLSALTGGRPSTAAIGTAAGAANQYQQQFAGTVLPELTRQSFERHQAQLGNEGKLLGILMDKETSEFDRQLAIEEFEWSRSDENPVIKGQMLNNIIKEFEIENMSEEWEWKVREWKSREIELDLLDKYAPELAALGRDKLREEVTQATIRTSEMAKEAEDNAKAKAANLPPTATNRTVYNSRRDKLNKDFGDDYSGMLEHVLQREDLYVNGSGGRDGMGQVLYDQLVEELQGNKDAAGKTVEPKQSPSYKNVNTAVSDIMKDINKKNELFDSEGVPSGGFNVTARETVVNRALDQLKAFTASGMITAAEAQEIALINGITESELTKWKMPASSKDFVG